MVPTYSNNLNNNCDIIIFILILYYYYIFFCCGCPLASDARVGGRSWKKIGVKILLVVSIVGIENGMP